MSLARSLPQTSVQNWTHLQHWPNFRPIFLLIQLLLVHAYVSF
ncbi:hypothetical protein CU007_1672 [Enterococcus faecium]|nr:hypothetical protein [Enterococcus faecium]